MVKNYSWFDGSGYLQIKLTQSQIDAVCRSGANDAAVAAESKPDLDADVLRQVLAEYGAWDADQLSDHAANLDRVFWLACWDCFDNPEDYEVTE